MILLFACLALAADPGADAAKQLQAIEQGIAQAVLSRDIEHIDKLFDPDFAYTGVHGERKTKAEVLAEIKAGEIKFDVLKFESVEVRLHCTTAVVTGRATTTGTTPQGTISGIVRYTRVYVQKDGQWKLVAFQGTPAKD
jgi:uncharacterized protein (TIGR02246 family)